MEHLQGHICRNIAGDVAVDRLQHALAAGLEKKRDAAAVMAFFQIPFFTCVAEDFLQQTIELRVVSARPFASLWHCPEGNDHAAGPHKLQRLFEHREAQRPHRGKY